MNYLNSSTSKPSDSFPGLMALMTGGSPRTYGAFYDVAYDRSLDPPALTTGNGVAGTPGLCTPYGAPSGTTTEFDEGIDIDQTQLNGGAPSGAWTVVSPPLITASWSAIPPRVARPSTRGTSFAPTRFSGSSTPPAVTPPGPTSTLRIRRFPDPGNGTNVDDYYSPEINSIPVSLPNVPGCHPLPDQTAVAASNAWTDSFQNIQCYDSLKVQAILNEINGRTHNGMRRAPRPAILGMNFQAVSVGQKLIEKSAPPHRADIRTPSALPPRPCSEKLSSRTQPSALWWRRSRVTGFTRAR